MLLASRAKVGDVAELSRLQLCALSVAPEVAAIALDPVAVKAHCAAIEVAICATKAKARGVHVT